MTRVLVTGGCGFIGSHLVELLAHKGHRVMILDDLSTGRPDWVQDVIVRKNVWFDLCDIHNREHLFAQIEHFRPEVICHLAAQAAISTSWKDPARNAQVNEIGTIWLLEAALKYGVRRVVMASTSAVYKETRDRIREDSPTIPESPYGISKLAAELYVRGLVTNSVILRLGNVYGPKQMPIGENQVVARVLKHFLYGSDFAIHGDGKQKRDFVYVEDVADAFLLSMWGKPGIYNIASGMRTSVNDLTRALSGIYEVPGYAFRHTADQDPRRDVILDTTRAKSELMWRAATTLKAGLAATAKWWDEFRKNDKRSHRA